jgi:hypothetical protein
MNKYYTLVECPKCHLVYHITGRYHDALFKTYQDCLCGNAFIPCMHIITEGEN